MRGLRNRGPEWCDVARVLKRRALAPGVGWMGGHARQRPLRFEKLGVPMARGLSAVFYLFGFIPRHGTETRTAARGKSKETKNRAEMHMSDGGLGGYCIPSKGGGDDVSVLGRWKDLHVTLLFFFLTNRTCSLRLFTVWSNASHFLSTVTKHFRFHSRGRYDMAQIASVHSASRFPKGVVFFFRKGNKNKLFHGTDLLLANRHAIPAPTPARTNTPSFQLIMNTEEGPGAGVVNWGVSNRATDKKQQLGN
ncbi:uncharacterized protein CCOS01_00975 [Colletotrichum costaricense]|uniref:Uncharacterized protein n=1 Tax=Colletotrichum costaricense TaxID=1209916 RepID=A0AAI9ZA35_9PEZI|nr:uncharacterized protein CCOS01_00975 [Colletotrichum costaricense]KAK1539661.1 hypothetical protein CCOS01_00975 [Colletotrichum costaricense]